jgi:RNA polymerase sigma-70 factor (ECF subfamily)
VRRYQERLYNTVFRLVDNAEDAHDVVQEAFLNAYQSLDSFKHDSRFFTWLYRIAINTAISLKRKQRSSLSIEAGRNGEGGVEPLDGSAFSRPGYALEQAEEERRIQSALNRLSPEHQAVLILKDIDGQKYEQMAKILQVPIGTIRSRLHRARAELRELLEAEEQ